MNIITVQTDNKYAFVLSEVSKRKDEAIGIVIFFRNNGSLRKVFDTICSDITFEKSRVLIRDSRLELGNNSIKFIVADWKSFCGMQYDVAVCYDEFDEETYMQVLAKVRGANNFEKSMYILKEFDLARGIVL